MQAIGEIYHRTQNASFQRFSTHWHAEQLAMRRVVLLVSWRGGANWVLSWPLRLTDVVKQSQAESSRVHQLNPIETISEAIFALSDHLERIVHLSLHINVTNTRGRVEFHRSSVIRHVSKQLRQFLDMACNMITFFLDFFSKPSNFYQLLPQSSNKFLLPNFCQALEMRETDSFCFVSSLLPNASSKLYTLRSNLAIAHICTSCHTLEILFM